MNTIVIGTINHSDIGVMFTNLAIVNGGPTLIVNHDLTINIPLLKSTSIGNYGKSPFEQYDINYRIGPSDGLP